MSRSSDAPQGLHMACQGQGGPVQYTYRAHRAPKPTGPRGQAPTIGPKAASHTALPHTRPHPTTCTGRARTASPSAIQGLPRALAAPTTRPSPKASAHVAGAAAGSPPSSQTNAQSTACCRARHEQTEQCERVRRSRSMQAYGLPRSSHRFYHHQQLTHEAHEPWQCSRRPPAT